MPPKITNKERDNQIILLTKEVTNLSRIFSVYLEWRNENVGFQKHLIDVNESIKNKSKEKK